MKEAASIRCKHEASGLTEDERQYLYGNYPPEIVTQQTVGVAVRCMVCAPNIRPKKSTYIFKRLTGTGWPAAKTWAEYQSASAI